MWLRVLIVVDGVSSFLLKYYHGTLLYDMLEFGKGYWVVLMLF